MSVPFICTINTPPVSNTGGTYQAAIVNCNGKLIRVPFFEGNKISDFEILKKIDTKNEAAFVDTLSFSFTSKNFYEAFPNSSAISSDGFDLVIDISALIKKCLGFDVTAKSERAKNNYKDSYVLGNDWGFLSLGGQYQNDTIHVYLNGQGCMAAKDGFENRLYDFLLKLKAKILRVDLACDYYDGTYTPQKARADHLAGLYKVKNSPKNLTSSCCGCWDYEELGIENKGLTYNIGSRQSSKYFRIYEKGRQLAYVFEKDDKLKDLFEKDFSNWTRIELELKNSDREIPLDVLVNAGKYLAGSAPALEFINDEQLRVKAKKKTLNSALKKAEYWIKKQFGKWLYVFEQMECTDEKGIVDDIKLAQKIKSLMIREIPKRFVYPDFKQSTSMDFSENEKTMDEIIEAVFKEAETIGKKLQPIYEKQERNFYEVENEFRYV